MSTKLRVILQSADGAIDHDTPLVELGIDSLVAVEVRSWFLKELKVDIPVLKVVGGSSLAEICELAMKKLPKELLASISTGDAVSQKPVTVAFQSHSPTPAKLQSAESGSSSVIEHDPSTGPPTISSLSTRGLMNMSRGNTHQTLQPNRCL